VSVFPLRSTTVPAFGDRRQVARARGAAPASGP